MIFILIFHTHTYYKDLIDGNRKMKICPFKAIIVSNWDRNFIKGVEKKAYTERYTRAYTGWKVNLGLHEKG